ncbi:signal peptidase II [Candidatus Parcubacteria bacterium]|nr:signal peptidase II [Candidatus Parcubacteria bacterium]
MFSCKKKMVYCVVLAIFFVILDRLFKVLAISCYENIKIDLIFDYFGFTLAKNYYIAFSLPLSGPILSVFIGVVILILLYFWLILIKKQEYSQASCLTFVILGAISNIIDRVKYGFVIDYLDLKYFTVFNIADSMIVAGVVLLIILNKKTIIKK